MILIYVHQSSPRLQHIAAFIFKEIIGVSYSITTNKKGFEEFEGIKINYSDENISGSELLIYNCGLLHQTNIAEQSISVSEFKGFKIFFQPPVSGHYDFPFDIFSACFYLINRYEEYLPHTKDRYGRYAHNNSIAYQENFLHLPLINIWIHYFIGYLQIKFPNFKPKITNFSFVPTYDIDIAFSFLHKGFLRNVMGSVTSVATLKFSDFSERLKVLTGYKKDPFDNFSWLNKLHKQYSLNPIYFFLVAEKNGLYDKNILPQTEAMQQLIIDNINKYSVGLHPSWQSGDNFMILKNEKKTLEKIGGRDVKKSRQHYLRFNLPEGYRLLSEAGLTGDYSMGYGSTNGFRASVASPFYWYDLEKEQQTKLKIHPFCYMDSNAIFHQKLSDEKAYDEIVSYYNICKQVNGTCITILHNHLSGSNNLQWQNMYGRFLASVATNK